MVHLYDLVTAGTMLLTNLDDALRNSEHWKYADTFDPRNFLDENGKYKKNEAFMPFGVGKFLNGDCWDSLGSFSEG